MKTHLSRTLVAMTVLPLALGTAVLWHSSTASAGDSPKPAPSCAAGEARIDVVGYRYRPVCGCKETSTRSKACTVPKGTRVTWRFADEDPHDAVAVDDRFPRSKRIKTGTYSHSFEKPGTYAYYCSLHRGMRGYSVIVR